MKTYLVTGGSGFIGSNFIHYMLKKYKSQIKIINLDKLAYAGNLENLKGIEQLENYSFVKGDICDRELVESLFYEYDIDRVVHFAAESHVDRSIIEPETFVVTNVLGTMILLNASKNAWSRRCGFVEGRRFLHVSTDEVYGSLGDTGFFCETTPYCPRNPYSASKASADMLVKSFIHTYGFPANITNCSNNYGPRQFPEKLIPLMISNAISGKSLPVYGDGLNIRDWLYVEDHVRALDMVLEKGRLYESYSIGGNNEKTNLEIVQIILDTLRELLDDTDSRKEKINEKLIKFVEDRKGHDRRYAIDSGKIRKETGWRPQTRFEEGIKKTIKWYLGHKDVL